MRFNQQKLAKVAVSLTLALILCINQPSAASPQSSGPISRGIGGLVGAASGAIAGGVAGANAGANAAEGNSSISASASASQSNGGSNSGSGGSASLSANANLSSGGSSSSSGSASGSISGGSSSSGGMSASGSASIDSGSSSSGSSGSSSSLSGQASISIGSSTPKPEGLVDKVKEIFKGGKEMIKNSVDSLTKDDKKDEGKISAEASASTSGGSGGSSMSGGASVSMSGSGSSSSSGSGSSSSGGSSSSSGSGSSNSGGASLSASANMQSSGSQGSSGSASASLSMGQSTPKPEGLLDKMSKIAEKGKEAIKDLVDSKKENSNSGSGSSMSGSVQGSVGGGISASASGSINSGSSSSSSGGSSSGSSSGGSGGLNVNANANINIGGKSGDDGMKKFDERREERKDGPIDKVQKLVSKGTDAVRETARMIEDKATTVTDKISKTMDDNIKKPMQQVSGSGQLVQEGQLSARAQATAQLKGADRDRHLIEVKKDQESKLSRPSSLKEVVTDAKNRGIIPQNEDRSALRGNHADEKSVAVEVFDKAHEMSKIPVESVLKPIDKMLGYEKDPLMRIYDNSHEILRRPLSLVSKPVESVLTGAFKTTDEAKKDSEKLLATTSEQERREAKLKEERARKEDRSVVGSIADKTLELATKPIEIVLKPFDHLVGFDKDGKKNPLLRALDEIYGLSKKPVDALAKPFETILKKMADGEHYYQVSLRFNDENSDPKLVTRLADGALNVADRVLTKPLEIVMKPLNHALGYDEPGKKNPIMEAAHQLKNATKVGVELFTRPIDRIIKEIADIGERKSDAQRDADLERQKQEASRLVQALDKLHEVIQYPFEIVLRPVGKVLGTTKNGRKDPFLRAWDVIHQVVRTPIQVISKPWEEAILGDKSRGNSGARVNVQARASANGQQQGQGQAGAKASIGANIGGFKAGASIQLKNNNNNNNSNNNNGANVNNEPPKKNLIVDGIKTVEKFATKPIDVITSPIRKLILGEDNEKVGSETDKNNREIQAKAQIGAGGNKASAQFRSGSGGKKPDKIMTTLEKMNNVILKPLEEITQPISDILSSEKKIEVKAQVSGQSKPQQQQQPQPQQQQQQQQQQQSKQQFSASAQAQIKKN